MAFAFEIDNLDSLSFEVYMALTFSVLPFIAF